MTHSNPHLDCVNHYLKDLLEGAVRAWDVVADVTVSDDRAEAQVTAANGVAVHITCRPGPTGDWQWHLSRLNGKTEQPRNRAYPSVLAILRALRAELAPDHQVYGLVITPRSASL
mgnify:FL=1